MYVPFLEATQNDIIFYTLYLSQTSWASNTHKWTLNWCDGSAYHIASNIRSTCTTKTSIVQKIIPWNFHQILCVIDKPIRKVFILFLLWAPTPVHNNKTRCIQSNQCIANRIQQHSTVSEAISSKISDTEHQLTRWPYQRTAQILSVKGKDSVTALWNEAWCWQIISCMRKGCRQQIEANFHINAITARTVILRVQCMRKLLYAFLTDR